MKSIKHYVFTAPESDLWQSFKGLEPLIKMMYEVTPDTRNMIFPILQEEVKEIQSYEDS